MVVRESSAPTREEQVAIVEAYFDCFVRKNFDAIPISPNYTSRTPLAPDLRGQAALDYFKLAAAGVNSIQIRLHIVEADRVATLLEEQTTNGPVEVMAMFEIRDGLIEKVVVSYDSRRLSAGQGKSA